MLMHWIAQAGEVSVGAVTAIIGAIFAGLGVVAGKLLEKRKQEIQLREPVPTVPIRKEPVWATVNELNEVRAHVLRVEAGLNDMRRDQAEQYRDLLQAGSAREQAITDKLDSVARAIHARIDELMKSSPKS